jgi:hypothetical protein
MLTLFGRNIPKVHRQKCKPLRVEPHAELLEWASYYTTRVVYLFRS